MKTNPSPYRQTDRQTDRQTHTHTHHSIGNCVSNFPDFTAYCPKILNENCWSSFRWYLLTVKRKENFNPILIDADWSTCLPLHRQVPFYMNVVDLSQIAQWLATTTSLRRSPHTTCASSYALCLQTTRSTVSTHAPLPIYLSTHAPISLRTHAPNSLDLNIPQAISLRSFLHRNFFYMFLSLCFQVLHRSISWALNNIAR